MRGPEEERKREPMAEKGQRCPDHAIGKEQKRHDDGLEWKFRWREKERGMREGNRLLVGIWLPMEWSREIEREGRERREKEEREQRMKGRQR